MRVTAREWFRYRLIDQVVSRTWLLMLLLAAGCMALVAAVSAVMLLATPAEVSANPAHAVWFSLMRALDPGTIGGDEGSAPFLLLMLVVTVGGILIVSMLVGVLSAALDTKLRALRRGRTRVVESGHTVVLGWSDEIYTVLSELAIAGDHDPRVIVLANDLSKEDMEDAVNARRYGRGLRVICRYGDPTKVDDLELARIDAASALIVPRPVGDDPDVRVLMTLLTLNTRSWPGGRPPVAAVVSSRANLRAAELALRGWPERLRFIVDAEDITARLVVQSRRHPGLSVACDELLSFRGVEVHLPDAHNRQARLPAGITYREALLRFDPGALIGVLDADDTVRLNPDPDYRIAATDTPIVVARGDGPRDIRSGRVVPVQRGASEPRAPRTLVRAAERTLVLGWNSRITRIVSVLDPYVAAGSTLRIVGPGYNKDELPGVDRLVIEDGIDAEPSDPGVLVPVDPDDPDDVPLVDAAEYDFVIVLAGDAGGSHADAPALVTLLHLREIKNKRNAGFAVICELVDDANRRHARVVEADDLVVGQRVVSSLAVQYAKNPVRGALTRIVAELFDASDSDMYFNPAAEYVPLGTPLSFATVVAAAADRRETAIGYQAAEQRLSEADNFGVHLNPPKGESRSFGEGDRVIVIAHDPERAAAVAARG